MGKRLHRHPPEASHGSSGTTPPQFPFHPSVRPSIQRNIKTKQGQRHSSSTPFKGNRHQLTHRRVTNQSAPLPGLHSLDLLPERVPRFLPRPLRRTVLPLLRGTYLPPAPSSWAAQTCCKGGFLQQPPPQVSLLSPTPPSPESFPAESFELCLQ